MVTVRAVVAMPVGAAVLRGFSVKQRHLWCVQEVL